MLNPSKKLILTTRLAFLSILLLIFMSCQQLFLNSNNSKSTVSFSISTPRAALSLAEGEKLFIDLALDGEYKASKTAEITSAEALQFTFEGVPVGKQVLASAEIYMMYDEVKLVLYAGESEKKAVIDGENPFTLPMQVAYNSIAKGTSSCLIMRPLFTSETTNEALKSNRLEFNSDSETFAYKINQELEETSLVLDEYQKAIITIKGAGEGEHTIRTKFVKSTTAAMYYQTPVTISAESKPYEMLIPQGIKLDTLGFENSWVDPPIDSWASDYSFVIEKIELFKDSSLIDPEFNVVTKTASTYTVKNPAVQIIAATKIDKNSITFDSKQGYYDTENGYSAAYWEFNELDQYDRITVKLTRTSTGETASNFVIRGYTPFDYSINQESNTSIIPAPGTETTPKYYRSVTNSLDFTLDLADLKTGLDKFSAISFQDNHGEANFGETWSMKIEEIKLEKTGTSNFSFTTPTAEGDITVTAKIGSTTINPGQVISVSTGDTVVFTAPSTYTTYVWKVNGEVQSSTTNVFNFTVSTIGSQIYNITLFADTETLHHSWQTEVNKS